MSMFISLLTVAVPLNYTSESRERFEAAAYYYNCRFLAGLGDGGHAV
jgi:hypothetical protein